MTANSHSSMVVRNMVCLSVVGEGMDNNTVQGADLPTRIGAHPLLRDAVAYGNKAGTHMALLVFCPLCRGCCCPKSESDMWLRTTPLFFVRLVTGSRRPVPSACAGCRSRKGGGGTASNPAIAVCRPGCRPQLPPSPPRTQNSSPSSEPPAPLVSTSSSPKPSALVGPLPNASPSRTNCTASSLA